MLKLRQIQIMKIENDVEIQNKIRVREIEILDDDNNIVARIGRRNGIFDSDGQPIITIYDSEYSDVVKIGRDEDGGEITVSGDDGFVNICSGSDGGMLHINHYHNDDKYRIVIAARQTVMGLFSTFLRGFIEIHKNDRKISLEANIDEGTLSVRGKNKTIDTIKKIFTIGS